MLLIQNGTCPSLVGWFVVMEKASVFATSRLFLFLAYALTGILLTLKMLSQGFLFHDSQLFLVYAWCVNCLRVFGGSDGNKGIYSGRL